jgi:hypothetical protein
MNWWNAPEYDRSKPMTFPERTNAKQEVIVVPVEKTPGASDQKPNDRVRVYV